MCNSFAWIVVCQVSSVHGISQARILEGVAISFSRGPSQPRDQTYVSCIGRRILYHWTTREAQRENYLQLEHQETYRRTQPLGMSPAEDGRGQMQDSTCSHFTVMTTFLFPWSSTQASFSLPTKRTQVSVRPLVSLTQWSINVAWRWAGWSRNKNDQNLQLVILSLSSPCCSCSYDSFLVPWAMVCSPL